MKVLPDMNQAELEANEAHTFSLPHGLIGFAAYTRAELLFLPNHLPFLWMKLHGPIDSVFFIVVEPGGVIPGYAPELFDKDAAELGLAVESEALVLNIVSLKNSDPSEATVNLVGPIIVNRRQRVGRQLVVANYSSYSAHYRLVDSRVSAVCA